MGDVGGAVEGGAGLTTAEVEVRISATLECLQCTLFFPTIMMLGMETDFQVLLLIFLFPAFVYPRDRPSYIKIRVTHKKVVA